MTKPKQMTRRSERALAFQVLYGLSFSPSLAEESIVQVRRAFRQSPDNSHAEALALAHAEALTKAHAAARAEERAVGEAESLQLDMHIEPQGFAWELVKGVWEKSKELDALIGRYSHRWRVNRLGRIELTLLRIGLFEMLYRDDVPAKVAINEALELLRQFGEAGARSFVNGILDATAKALENGEIQRSDL